MSIFLAILLGLVQGLTEFLPVSSSGHLALIQMLLGSDAETDYMLFDVLLHFGTLIAVVIAFWKDIRQLLLECIGWIRAGFRIQGHAYRRFIVLLLITIVPIFLILPVKSYIEQAMGSVIAVGVMLLLTAALLLLSEKANHGKKTEQNAKWTDALLVGVAQCFAVLPGLSRSGSTMVAGLLCGFSRDFAVRFAFIMSIPVILGANILEISEAIAQPSASTIPLYLYLIGMAVALISGLAAIRMVRFVAKRGNFRPFAVYCILVGVIAIAAGVLQHL